MKKAKILTIYILLLSLLILSPITINNHYTYFKSRNKNDKIVKSADYSDNGGGYIMNTEATYAWEEINTTGTILGNTTFAVKEL
ncbi:MAG: hypothetical protein ACFFC1_03350, partial [Promethearchaeota archaeon]